jgi:hypothetical protein
MNHHLIENEIFTELKTSVVCIVEQLDYERLGLIDFGHRVKLEFNGHGSLFEYRNHLSSLYELFKAALYDVQVDENADLKLILRELNLRLKELGSGLKRKNLKGSLAGVEISWPLDSKENVEWSAIQKKTLRFLIEQSNCLRNLNKCINHFSAKIYPEIGSRKKVPGLEGQLKMAFGGSPIIDHKLIKYELVEVLAALHATGKIEGDRIDFFRAMEPVFGMSFEDSAKVVGKIKAKKGERMTMLTEMMECFTVILEKEYR